MNYNLDNNDVYCFFNFRSPYAYIGIKKALDQNIDLKFIPFCYVPKEIIEAVTINNPYKRDYLMEDCERLFDDINIKIVNQLPADCNWPSVHAAWLAVNNHDNKGLDFMLNIFQARFIEGLNVGDKDVLTNICIKIDINPDIAISAMDDEEIDYELKSFTRLMRELKVFGVPTFIYKKQRFWGQDRVNYLRNTIE